MPTGRLDDGDDDGRFGAGGGGGGPPTAPAALPAADGATVISPTAAPAAFSGTVFGGAAPTAPIAKALPGGAPGPLGFNAGLPPHPASPTRRGGRKKGHLKKKPPRRGRGLHHDAGCSWLRLDAGVLAVLLAPCLPPNAVRCCNVRCVVPVGCPVTYTPACRMLIVSKLRACCHCNPVFLPDARRQGLALASLASPAPVHTPRRRSKRYRRSGTPATASSSCRWGPWWCSRRGPPHISTAP